MHIRLSSGVRSASREGVGRSSSRYASAVADLLLVILFLAVVAAYALLLRWIGEYADRKGYTYWGFVLFSLFVSPLIGGFLAYVLPDKAGPDHLPRAQR